MNSNAMSKGRAALAQRKATNKYLDPDPEHRIEAYCDAIADSEDLVWVDATPVKSCAHCQLEFQKASKHNCRYVLL
jgi:hypothetical protein